MSPESYQNLIIGSGEAGKWLAWHLGPSQKTAVVERRWIGGSCPNINCLPSKNEVWSATIASYVHHAQRFGTHVSGGSTDMAAVRKRKREMVEMEIAAHLELYKASGTELIMGQATFTGPKTVQVQLNDGGTRTLTGERVFLNLGTHALIPPVPGLAECKPLTHIEALELDRLPEHLIVIGGGYVGLEFAQAYCRFGSRVTVLQQGSQLLPNADLDVVAELQQILASEGVEIITSANIVAAQGQSGSQVVVTIRTSDGETHIAGSDILVAAGRTPNTSGIGLELAGVELDQRGYIQVNERLETTAQGTWAVGECAGSPQFTHVSFDDFRVVRDNLAGGNHTTRDRIIPSCLFTDPQVAQIGLNETEAKRRGIAVQVVKLPAARILRTHTTGDTHGFLKALLNPENGQILGFTMVGSEAGEVMAVVQSAMLGHLPYTALRDAIITHPTMAEGLTVLFSTVKAESSSKKVEVLVPKGQQATPSSATGT